jgi:hypothetical protein
MRLRGALLTAMRAWRQGPSGIRAAVQPDGGRVDPSPLDYLLAAATAPASPAELAGERRATANFVRVRRSHSHRAGAGGSVGPPRLRRAVLVKVTVGVTVALAGGTAFAAQSGRLPAGAEQRIHDALPFLAPPAPPHGTPATSPSAGDGSARPQSTESVAGSTSPHLVELCVAWRDRQDGTPGRAPLTGADLAALTAAAGSAERIPDFCGRMLASAAGRASPTGTPQAAPVTPSHPGSSPHPHPTPKR